MCFKGYIRKCKEIEKYRRRKSTVFDSTASTSGREDIDMFTRQLLGMYDVGSARAKEKSQQQKQNLSEVV